MNTLRTCDYAELYSVVKYLVQFLWTKRAAQAQYYLPIYSRVLFAARNFFKSLDNIVIDVLTLKLKVFVRFMMYRLRSIIYQTLDCYTVIPRKTLDVQYISKKTFRYFDSLMSNIRVNTGDGVALVVHRGLESTRNKKIKCLQFGFFFFVFKLNVLYYFYNFRNIYEHRDVMLSNV